MYDRNVEFPNRYQLVKVEGTDDIYDIVPAPGTVNNEGTLVNKNSLLKDATAALFGMGASAVPDDVLDKLSASVLAQKTPIPLSSFTEGDTIQLNENGSPVDFIIAKHDYESGLNGAGKTLLVRKNAVDERMAWNSAGVNTYSGSTIDVWFNSNYKSRLDSDVQEQIGTTKFYYTVGGGNSSVSELERSVFALSCTELGVSYSSAAPNVEGSLLPTSSLLASATLDDSSKITQHVRSSNPRNSTEAYYVKSDGTQAVPNSVGGDNGPRPRPAFTLPSDFAVEYVTEIVDARGNEVDLGGVKIETGSYVGTGKYGASNPNTLTFGFAPKLIIAPWMNNGGDPTPLDQSNTSSRTIVCDMLSQEYKARLGFGTVANLYAKKSSDGRTISWYANSDGAQQNSSGIIFHYVAIG